MKLHITPVLILFAQMLFLISSCHKEHDLNSEISTTTIDGWEITKGTNTLHNFSMREMFFLNRNTGFVIKFDEGIYKTTDGCKTWSLLNPESYRISQSVFFLNATTGFASGQSLFSKTTDGGKTWKTYESQYYSIYSIRFFDEYKGMAVIQKGPFSSYQIAITSDAGIHWKDMDFNVAFVSNNIKPQYVDNVLFVNGEASNKIYKSKDQGQTWDTIFGPTQPNSQSTIYFCSENVGFYSDNKDVYKTLNGGLTWVKKDFPYTSLYGLHFFDENDGLFIVPEYELDDVAITHYNFIGNYFYTTWDGGETWNNSGLLKYYKFGTLDFPEPGFGYALNRNEVYTLRKK